MQKTPEYSVSKEYNCEFRVSIEYIIIIFYIFFSKQKNYNKNNKTENYEKIRSEKFGKTLGCVMHVKKFTF